MLIILSGNISSDIIAFLCVIAGGKSSQKSVQGMGGRWKGDRGCAGSADKVLQVRVFVGGISLGKKCLNYNDKNNIELVKNFEQLEKKDK